MVIDKDFSVKDFNGKLCEILQVSEDKVSKLDIKLLLKDIIKDENNFSNNRINYKEANLYLENRKLECNINVSPVKLENKYIGYVILVKKIDSIRNVVRKIAGFSSKYTFESIITNNKRMLSVIEEAKKLLKMNVQC